MATVVFINRLQPADGKRDALIGLLREFADSINADPECLHSNRPPSGGGGCQKG
jgi:quinol monooxygenase YgiN